MPATHNNVYQENTASADPQDKSGPDLESRSRLASLLKFNGDFFALSYVCDIIFMKIQQVSTELWANFWKNALSCIVEESFKKFIHLDPCADHVQHLISFTSVTDTFVVKFWWRCSQWFLHDATNKQIRKTDKCRVKRNLLGRGRNVNTELPFW